MAPADDLGFILLKLREEAGGYRVLGHRDSFAVLPAECRSVAVWQAMAADVLAGHLVEAEGFIVDFGLASAVRISADTADPPPSPTALRRV